MKKLVLLILAAILVFSACSCSVQKPKKSENGATDDEANYPTPEDENFVECKSETGLRYSMNLDRYTSALNKMFNLLGGGENEFPYKKWKLLRTEKQSNGENYRYYALDNGKVVMTATVESESMQIVNLGCGITAYKFNKSADTQQKVMTVCGTMAAVAGGYKEDDVPFFGNLYVDAISAEEHCFWYGNSIYLYDEQKDKSGEITLLFRTIPASSTIEHDWNLTDYKSYWFESKK